MQLTSEGIGKEKITCRIEFDGDRICHETTKGFHFRHYFDIMNQSHLLLKVRRRQHGELVANIHFAIKRRMQHDISKTAMNQIAFPDIDAQVVIKVFIRTANQEFDINAQIFTDMSTDLDINTMRAVVVFPGVWRIVAIHKDGDLATVNDFVNRTCHNP